MGTSTFRCLFGLIGAAALAVLLAGCAPPPGSYTVNTTADGVDANPGDGVCEMTAGAGDCSLRAAVDEVNASAGNGDITVPSGTYTLTLAGSDNANAVGDLDITTAHHLLVHAPQPGAQIVAAGRDRALDIFGPDVIVLGIAASGASGPGIEVRGGANLVFAAGASVNNGGAGVLVDQTGHLDLTNATLAGNSGGGINDGGTASLTFATVAGNVNGIRGAGTTTLSASVVANQTGGVDCTNAVTSAGYNLDSDGTCGLGGPGDTYTTPAGLGALSTDLLPVKAPNLGSSAVNAVPFGSGPCTGLVGDEHGTARPVTQACDRGAVEADFALSLVVDTAADEHDTNPGDGVCATVAAQCSLRAALDEINVRPVTIGHTIALAADPTITLAGRDEDSNGTGDFDIGTPLTIHGAGHTISGASLDRVLDARSSAGRVRLDNLRLTQGLTDGYGGGTRDLTGDLVVDQVTMSLNVALVGGGLYEGGASVDVRRSTFNANSAYWGGGGIYADHEVLVSQSTVTANSSAAAAGVVAESGSITATTLGTGTGTTNLSPRTGGSTITVSGSIIASTSDGPACDAPNIGLQDWLVSGGYNVVSETTCHLTAPTDRQGVPVLVGPLTNNGGPTRSLLPSSSNIAVDLIPTGTPGLCDAAAPTDQRGAARPQNGSCDAGSVEGAGPAQTGLTLTVDTAADSPDATPGNGVCATGAGACSLRAAITETNATAAADTVTIAGGVNPALALAGPREDANATGDLDVHGYLTIAGAGATIDAAGLDRAFDVRGGAITIIGTTLTGGVAAGSSFATNGGAADSGGALQVLNADLTLDDSTVRANTANPGAGGAIALVRGGVSVLDSTIDDNTATAGSAIFMLSAAVRIDRSTVSHNHTLDGQYSGGTTGASGVLWSTYLYSESTLSISSSTISANDQATGPLLTGSGAVRYTTIIDNTGVRDRQMFNGRLEVSGTVVRSPLTMASCSTAVTSGGWNVTNELTGCFTHSSDVVGASPLAPPLAANGGPTLTHLPYANSPAVDLIPAGTPGLCDGTISADQRGVPRPVATGCDAGSVEGSGPALPPLSLVVNAAADVHDATPGDGVCATAAAQCTLRAAIDETNARATPDTITITPGINPVRSLSGPDDTNAAGDLDILDTLTINGNGAIIDSAGNDRAFDIQSVAASITGVTLTGGVASSTNFLTVDGGGLRVVGALTLTDSTVSNNQAVALYASGGGIQVGERSRMTLLRVTVTGNSVVSNDPAAKLGGGGLQAAADADLAILDSAVTGNHSNRSGGGIETIGATLTIRNSTISGNTATGEGTALNLGPRMIPGVYPASMPTVGATIIASTIVDAAPSASSHVIARITQLTIAGSVIQSTGTPLCGALDPASFGISPPPVVGAVTSGGSNVATDASCALTAIADTQTNSILLGPLGAHGGPTPTHVPPGGHPAIDRIPNGTPSLCDATTPTDQRGSPRPNGPACDSGAVEN